MYSVEIFFFKKSQRLTFFKKPAMNMKIEILIAHNDFNKQGNKWSIAFEINQFSSSFKINLLHGHTEACNVVSLFVCFVHLRMFLFLS